MDTHPRRWTALVVLSLTLVAVTLDNSVLNTALPSLARALRASTSDLQWITDAYTLLFASALILAGGIGARLGSRRALIGGLAVFGGGSALAGLSNSPAQLIGWRAVMGLGAAFVMPATLAIITRMFAPAERPKAFGIWSAAAGVGVLVGPVTGGALLDHFTWRSAFWINVPLVVAALIAIALIVPGTAVQRLGRLDIVGAILSTAAVATLVDAIIEAPDRGWLARTTLVELGATALLGAGFVLWELRRDEPLVQVRLFKNHRFVLAALALAVTFFALFGTLFELSQYLQLVHGYTPLVAGLGAMPFAVAMATTSGTSSLVSRRLGIRGTLTVGLLLVGGGLALLSRSSADSAFAYVAASTAVVGAGMGMMMAPASLEITGSVPAPYASMAGALNSVVRELGGVLGIAAIGTIVSAAYRAHPGAGRDIASAPVAFTDAMDRGVLVAAAVAIVAAVLMFVGLRRPAVVASVREPVMV